jgi:hypothetical protein
MSVSGKSGVLTCNVEQVENVTTNQWLSWIGNFNFAITPKK